MGDFLNDYEPVEDRLRQFWRDHPFGRVITELLAHADGDYIVHASVYFGNETRNDPPTATGLAHDSVASLPANMKSSALEVCETSAIGRALANCGYAAKGKRPSREEMAKSSDAMRDASEEASTGSEGTGRKEPEGPELAALLEAVNGSASRAATLLNRANRAAFTPKTIKLASASEVVAALELVEAKA